MSEDQRSLPLNVHFKMLKKQKLNIRHGDGFDTMFTFSEIGSAVVNDMKMTFQDEIYLQ
jgi:hypothetical protein